MKIVALGQITSLISSGSTPLGGAKIYLDQGPVMLIRSQNVLMRKIYLDDVAFITDDIAVKMKRTTVQNNDVLLNITGASIGRVATFELDCQANVNQHVCIIRPIPELLDHRYLMHFLSQPIFQENIYSSQNGGTRQALNFSQIRDFQIPLPPLEEQKRIAAILDQAEELRSQRRKAIGLLDELVRSVFLEMFGDPVTNPKGWKTITLGEVTKFTGGGTPKREKPEYFEGSICWATSKDMKCEFLEDTQEHITPQAIEDSATNLVPPGTVLIVVKSKILAHSLPIAITKVPTCFGQDIKGMTIAENCDTMFVVTALRHGKKWLLDRARGINTEGLTLEHLRAFPLLFPPLPLQKEFAQRVAAIETLKANHRQSLAKLDQLFASLQHRAFRGEL